MISTLLGGSDLQASIGMCVFRAKALTRLCRCRRRRRFRASFPSLEASLWNSSSSLWGSGSPGENLSSRFFGAGDGGVFVVSLLGALLGRVSLCLVCVVFSYVGFGGCRGSGPGRLMCAEAAASESDARGGSMGRGDGSALLGWQSWATWVAGLSVRSTRSRGGGLTLRRGCSPGCGATFVVCERLPWAAWAAGSWVVRRCCSRGAVVCRGGGPGRRCRLIALGATERWMSGRRSRENLWATRLL